MHEHVKKMNRSFKLFHVVTVPQSLSFFNGQIQFMTKHGVEVHAVSSPGKRCEFFAEREKITVHPVVMLRAISPFRDLLSVWHLYKLFKKYRPDIVHAHTPKGGLLGTIAAFLARVRVRIYTVHGLPYVTAPGIKRSLLRLTEKISCILAHRVYCVSHSLARQVIDERICPKEKIRVIHNGSINGVDAIGRFNAEFFRRKEIRASLEIPEDALVIGFVGRIVRDKGILELVRAWNNLRKKRENLHLLMVGDFEEKDGVGEAVQLQLHADSRVHLTGYVTKTEPYYSAMDVLAFPTHREGFGVVGIEAAAMEVPVVATRIPGCIDSVIDGETGTLVPPGNSEALLSALNSYIEDKDLREKHGKAGRKRVLLKFQPEDIWRDLLSEYIQLLNVK